MHDVVVDALGRIEAAEEAAAMDRESKGKRGRPSNPPWAIESEIIGHVKQSDIPELMTNELTKAMLVKDGVMSLARALYPSTSRSLKDYAETTSRSLKDYADGTYKMPYAVGQRLVRYLEERAKKSGAAPVAADATPKSKAATVAPAAIVPQQPANDMEALRAELQTRLDENMQLRSQILEVERKNANLRAELDTTTAKLASVQGREMSELEDEVETLRRRVAHYEADDAACGPARVEELEDRLSRAHDEHVRDLELIRDLTRRLVAHGAC